MQTDEWQTKFKGVYDHGMAAWRAGHRLPATMFTQEDVALLSSIGCTAQELFDFVEDGAEYGEPDFDTVLAVQAIRQDYFHSVMGGQPSGHVASMNDLPAKSAAVDGIEWLPRIIVKARLKLRGEMPSDLMYGCGGDRPFLRRMKMSLPDFLKLVWASGEEDGRIIHAVKRCAGLA